MLSRAIICDLCPPNLAASRLGYIALGVSLVPMIAPMIGAALAEMFGWRSVFILLLAAGGLMIRHCRADLDETAPASVSFAQQFRSYPQLITSRRF